MSLMMAEVQKVLTTIKFFDDITDIENSDSAVDIIALARNDILNEFGLLRVNNQEIHDKINKLEKNQEIQNKNQVIQNKNLDQKMEKIYERLGELIADKLDKEDPICHRTRSKDVKKK